MNILENANITSGTRVLVRLDLDVPFVNGVPTETYRLMAGLKTLNYILKKGGNLILMGHIGKPENNFDKTLSTKQLIPFYNQHLKENSYQILENLRFDSREVENSLEFAQELAKKADIYVNESFATSHREHASIVGITKFLKGYAGFNLVDEIENLKKLKHNFDRPFVVIIGGAKLESKMPVINTFLKLADNVLLGSKLGPEWLLQNNKSIKNLILPVDYALDKKDIGKKTIKNYTNIISQSKTVLWAGPMGVYEDENFIEGTKQIAKAITNNPNIWSVIGGGDTISAVNKCGFNQGFDFVSTGGGAMLEFLAHETLPGIEVLKQT